MQGNMPREIKDIIRNVQQMDLPENGIADIRIKIQGGEVLDRPMFANGGPVSPFGTSLRQQPSLLNNNPQYMGQRPQLGQGGPDISNQAIGTPMQQQMQSMQQNPLATYRDYLGQKYIGPKQEQELQKVEEFVDLVGRAEQQQFGGGQQGGGQFSNMRQPERFAQTLGPESLSNPMQRAPQYMQRAPQGQPNPTGPLGGEQTMGPRFADGGAANKFPDLSGDGKVTQKTY